MSVAVVDGPFGSDLKVDDYQASGVPLVRVSNCRTGQIVRNDDLVYISPEKHASLIRSEVLPGDVLVTKAGHILGYSAVFPAELVRGNITSHLASIRPCRDVNSQYLSEYLASPIGVAQIYRWGNKSTRPELNTDEVRKISVVLPSLDRQHELVEAMDAARATRRAKLAEADALLGGLDAYLLAVLGLVLPAPAKRNYFSVSRGSLDSRLDPHFYAPWFVRVNRVLAVSGARELGDLAAFSHEAWDPVTYPEETFRYIEIGGVRTAIGEATTEDVETSKAPSRARMLVRDGDILVSLTRPHYGAIAQVGADLDGCTASTGFAVLRDIQKSTVTPEYLWCALRTQVCLGQMLQRSSGGNYPAITEAELARVLVPVPDLATQQSIAAEIRHRRERARALRAEAEQGWADAKRWFEEQLLGPAP